MPKIFISYRRADTTPWVGRIYDRLTDEMRDSFHKKDVFRDIDNIPPGADFRIVVNDFLADCDVVLVVIGAVWLSIQDSETGKRRLDDPNDTLRIEVATALKRGDDCLVIPLLIDGALMPTQDALPGDMKALTVRNAHFIHDKSFSHDVNKLIQFIKSKSWDDDAPSVHVNIEATFEAYEKALYDKHWHDAKRLADLIRNSPHFDDAVIEGILKADEPELDEVIRITEEAQHQHDFEAKRQKQYEKLRLLKDDKKRFLSALSVFKKTYLNYDPDNLYFNNIEYISKVFDIFPNDSLFEWVRIPSGDVTLTTGGYLSQMIVFQVAEFAISKYPITIAQYRIFVDLHGYTQDRFWTKEGLKFQGLNRLTQPRDWNHTANIHHPVTGISWYEAIAFCNWLSEVTGDNISLPTEQQWQRAAQGDDNRLYPWGNEWDASRCNNNVEGKGIGTTDVHHYEKVADNINDGKSPFGVVDMSGNVLEWCLTGYETGSNTIEGQEQRCLRGGSWTHNSKESFQVTYRRGQYPAHRNDDWGFRIVSLPKNNE